jgi:hypothetical protein
MPAPALHVLGCDLQPTLYDALQGPLDGLFEPFGFRVADEILATDEDCSETRFAAVLEELGDPTSSLNLFRGTKYRSEWQSDAEAWMEPNPYGLGKVHHGFKCIGTTLRLKSGRPIISTLAAYHRRVCMGHSLGGPEATGLAARINADELICYASPKPGDLAYSRWVRGLVGKITLYQNVKDLVPRLPFTIDDPLDEFDFQPIQPTVMMDASKYDPPVFILPTQPVTVESRLEDAHSTTISYKPLIAALP